MHKKALIYLVCSLWNITVCWPIVLLAHVISGERGRLRIEKPPTGKGLHGLWTTLKPDSFVLNAIRKIAHLGKDRVWGAITLGHGGFYGPKLDDDDRTPIDDWTPTEMHENRHVIQYEGTCFLFVLPCALSLFFTHNFLYSFAPLWACWPLYVGANSLVAMLHGGHGYKNAEHEQAARCA